MNDWKKRNFSTIPSELELAGAEVWYHNVVLYFYIICRTWRTLTSYNTMPYHTIKHHQSSSIDVTMELTVLTWCELNWIGYLSVTNRKGYHIPIQTVIPLPWQAPGEKKKRFVGKIGTSLLCYDDDGHGFHLKYRTKGGPVECSGSARPIPMRLFVMPWGSGSTRSRCPIDTPLVMP